MWPKWREFVLRASLNPRTQTKELLPAQPRQEKVRYSLTCSPLLCPGFSLSSHFRSSFILFSDVVDSPSGSPMINKKQDSVVSTGSGVLNVR